MGYNTKSALVTDAPARLSVFTVSYAILIMSATEYSTPQACPRFLVVMAIVDDSLKFYWLLGPPLPLVLDSE